MTQQDKEIQKAYGGGKQVVQVFHEQGKAAKRRKRKQRKKR